MWSNSGTVWWNKVTVMVEQWEECGGTVEQSWVNSVVEKSNSHGGRVWCNSGTVMVEQWNIDGATV